MTTVNVQATEFAARYVDPEGVPISANQALLGSGSPNTPKIGTLIPNRIFVGGIPSNTTEQELKAYFSSFGQVKDVKIINDRLGVAKGSYGFVTFECQEVAEKIIKNESETLIFKDRKLNIGHAIRKQQLFPRPADVAPTLFFPGGAAIPCGFQSGLPVFPLTGQDYSVLAQQGSAYQQMLLQQANGAAMYLSPQSANQQAAAAAAAAVQYSALQSQLAAAQQNAAAYATLQQQQHQQYPQAASLTGQLTAAGSQSQAAMLAAAMAAASQWPNAASTPVNGHNTSGSVPPPLTPAPVGQHTAPATVDATQSPNVAALAAAAAAAAWRWFSPAAVTQHNGNGALLASSPTAACGQSASQQQIHSAEHQQQLVFLPNTTTTSDYSTDHSAHSSGLLESVEPGMFHCEGLSMSPPQHPLQPTLLPFFAPAVFESGIAATSSPVIARQLVSPSNNNGHIITNCTNGTNQTPQNPNLYGTPAPQPIIYSGAGVNGNGLVVVDHAGKQNGGGRGSSPKKLTTTNGAAASTRTAI
ncbi:unnamed protein product [Hymenolepis diminuta]|uniref:RRM domain-containing protein n=2 Tax=Hymenolepis diminuta TaxID=6216 RepID=A0A564XY19_HYMDI|nr:unnamed protein product [Hymenolepis diminuta]